jgi:hypothetical protein
MYPKGNRHVLMDETPGAGGAGAAPAPAPAGAPAAPAPPAPAPAPAAPAPARAPAPAAGGEGAAGGDGSGAAGSALSAGKGAEGAGGDGGAAGAAPGLDAIPEKFRVKGANGEVDPLASAAKVAEAYAALEKRLGGGGGARPKTPADYKLPELPEALKGAELEGELTDAFREKAHKAGLSQEQFEFVMGQYFDLAPQLVNGGQAVSAEETIAALKSTWGKDYQTNAANAWRGLTQVAQAAGLTVAEVEAELGNNAAFNRIMAAVGAQMREDTSVNTGGSGAGAAGGMSEAAALQASEAFRNPRHPEHKVTVEKWNRIVTKGVADAPVV